MSIISQEITHISQHAPDTMTDDMLIGYRKGYFAGATRTPTDREIDTAALAIYTGATGMSREATAEVWPRLNPDAKAQYRYLARLALHAARKEAMR